MAHLIDKDALVAEIEKTQKRLNIDDIGGRSVMAWSEVFKNFIDTLEVKEIGVDLGDPKGDKSAKYIIDTNTLEVKEVDLEKEIDNIWNPRFNFGWDEKSLLSINHEGFTTIAKHFFELGLQSQNEEKIVAEEEGTCNKILNRIVGKSWNIICPVYEMNVNNGEKVKIRIIKGE